jgi:hypothetical protein
LLLCDTTHLHAHKQRLAVGVSTSTFLHNRIQALIPREKAQLLWNSHHHTVLSPQTNVCLQTIHNYLIPDTNPWEEAIGFIIPRLPHFTTVGDASKLGGGAHCAPLAYWFDLLWSPALRHSVSKLKPTNAAFVHINSLDFIVVIVQLAAVTSCLLTLSPDHRQRYFPAGFHAQPVCLCLTDNTSSMAWANKVTSKSLHRQTLIGVFAELLRFANIGFNSEHLAGILNDSANDISRPTFPYLPISARHEKISLKHA